MYMPCGQVPDIPNQLLSTHFKVQVSAEVTQMILSVLFTVSTIALAGCSNIGHPMAAKNR